MSDRSAIEWTDSSWNPIMGELVEGVLDLPLRWKKPRRIFVNSMSDLFHEQVPDEWIDKIFGVMIRCPQHQFQVLTKRPEWMLAYMSKPGRQNDVARTTPEHDTAWLANYDGAWGPSNVWLGVSVENQEMADERIPFLLQTPAAVRFLSVEPLLGPVDLRPWLMLSKFEEAYRALGAECPGGGRNAVQIICDWNGIRPPSLHWIIVGGESGPNARPCDLAWIRAIIQQCRSAGVSVFVKQLGSRLIVTDATCSLERAIREGGYRLRDRKGGDRSEWPKDLRVREFPR